MQFEHKNTKVVSNKPEINQKQRLEGIATPVGYIQTSTF